MPSTTGYLMPLRALNTAGKWRIVVNGVKAHYETLTQVDFYKSFCKQIFPTKDGSGGGVYLSQIANMYLSQISKMYLSQDGSGGGVLDPWHPVSPRPSLL